jgi:molecular chaperone HscB
MICWSCERNVSGETAAGQTPALCPQCGAIQPPDAAADLFAVLGLPRRFALDLPAAEAAFKNLSRQLHPDRFAKADPRARRASLQRTVQLNEAWRTLRDPVSRAEYLLRLSGYLIGAEEGASRPAGAGEAQGQTAGRVRIAAPQELLMEILEMREALGEARDAEDRVGDRAGVSAIFQLARARSDAAVELMSSHLAGDVLSEGDLSAAAQELVRLRYYRRFLAEASPDEPAPAAAQERHA